MLYVLPPGSITFALTFHTTASRKFLNIRGNIVHLSRRLIFNKKIFLFFLLPRLISALLSVETFPHSQPMYSRPTTSNTCHILVLSILSNVTYKSLPVIVNLSRNSNTWSSQTQPFINSPSSSSVWKLVSWLAQSPGIQIVFMVC